ncbi:unnamed protein product [Clonostachys chloroleuca]|uniref:DUF7735 domain-containing protein n=1 Tax=Clonostachys chloroleuca TaxID=1926264 RepID=A0AA35Q6F1_9HYPO|nr:unnamed protein product [Clonostachys chloroleuca]
MLFNKMTVLAAAVSGAAAAAQPPAPTAVLDERDTAACASAALKYGPGLLDLPTPKNTNILTLTGSATKSCEIPAVTGTLASEYSSYWSQFSSWHKEHVTDISNLVKACSDDLTSLMSGVTFDSSVLEQTSCSSLSWPSQTGGSSSDDSKNNTNSSNNSTSSNNDKGGAGSRQTAGLVGAAAFAGIVAVALL